MNTAARPAALLPAPMRARDGAPPDLPGAADPAHPRRPLLSGDPGPSRIMAEQGAIPPVLSEGLGEALERCRRLLPPRDPFAFALDLGDLELPPVTGGSPQEQRQLRELAPLYLASELESTRLLPAVELLAGLFVSGGLNSPLGDSASRLLEFHRGRQERLSAAERESLFGRLFGTPYGPDLAGTARNTEFEPLMISFAQALAALAPGPLPGWNGPAEDVRLQTVAAALADNLLRRGGGIVGYAARDILAAVQTALDVLKEPLIQAALEASSVWSAVAVLAQRYLGQRTDVASHVTRARSGVTLIAWLAEALPSLGGPGGQLTRPDGETIGAAEAWLQATRTLFAARPQGVAAGV